MKSPGILIWAKISPGYMASILSSSCEQICISFPHATPTTVWNLCFKWEKSEAKNAASICPIVQSLNSL